MMECTTAKQANLYCKCRWLKTIRTFTTLLCAESVRYYETQLKPREKSKQVWLDVAGVDSACEGDAMGNYNVKTPSPTCHVTMTSTNVWCVKSHTPPSPIRLYIRLHRIQRNHPPCDAAPAIELLTFLGPFAWVSINDLRTRLLRVTPFPKRRDVKWSRRCTRNDKHFINLFRQGVQDLGGANLHK